MTILARISDGDRSTVHCMCLSCGAKLKIPVLYADNEYKRVVTDDGLVGSVIPFCDCYDALPQTLRFVYDVPTETYAEDGT